MKMLDKLRLFVAFVLVMAGIVAYYILPESKEFSRVAAVVGGIVLAALVVLFSELGRSFIAYARASVAETRKVVWPTRQETNRLTFMVFIFVFALAFFMWVVDSGLYWFFYDVLLHQNS